MAEPMPPAPPVMRADLPASVRDSAISILLARRPIAPHAQVTLRLVAGEALDLAEARAVFAHQGARFVGQHALVGDRLDELADPEPAGIAGGALGGQRVVGADHLIAIGHIRARAEEERAIIRESLEEPIWLPREHLDVLAGDLIRHLQQFCIGIAEDDFAIIAPGLAGQIGRWQRFQLAADLRLDAIGQRAAAW